MACSTLNNNYMRELGLNIVGKGNRVILKRDCDFDIESFYGRFEQSQDMKFLFTQLSIYHSDRVSLVVYKCKYDIKLCTPIRPYEFVIGLNNIHAIMLCEPSYDDTEIFGGIILTEGKDWFTIHHHVLSKIVDYTSLEHMNSTLRTSYGIHK